MLNKIVFFIFFFLISIIALAKDNEGNRNIYILKSSGVCDGCAEAISKMLFTKGIKSQILGPDQLKTSVTINDLLIIGGGIPGGEGEWTIKEDLLKVDAFNWLKKYIANGGRYLGICAGSYLTEKWIDQSSNEKGLDIFPGKIDIYTKDKSAKYIEVNWLNNNTNRWVYFQDGPAFFPDQNADLEVFARFKKDQTPAALMFNYQKGKVALISPHLEADTDWGNEIRIKDKDGSDYDLGITIVKKLLK